MNEFTAAPLPYSFELRGERGGKTVFHYPTYSAALKSANRNGGPHITFTDASGNEHPCGYIFGQKDDELWPDEVLGAA